MKRLFTVNVSPKVPYCIACKLLFFNIRLCQIFSDPLVSLRRPRNLRDLLVYTKPKTSEFSTGECKLPGTYPCNIRRWKTCTYTRNLQAVQYRASRDTFTVKRHFTCTSSSVMYLITCSTCDGCSLCWRDWVYTTPVCSTPSAGHIGC